MHIQKQQHIASRVRNADSTLSINAFQQQFG